MSTKSVVLIFLAIGVSAAGGFRYFMTTHRDVEHTSVVAQSSKTASNTRTQVFDRVAADTVAPNLIPALESKSTTVSHLVASGTPNDLYKAWSILATCNDRTRDEQDARSNTPSGPIGWMNERSQSLSSGALSKATKDACGDLTTSQLGNRLEHLEKAAAAGEPHAVFGLMREGPWGAKSAMYLRWQDPAVQEWLGHMLQLLKLAAAKGNLDALDTLVDQYRNGGGLVKVPDASAALMYATAYSSAYEKVYGKPISRSREQLLRELGSSLSTEDAERARNAGQQVLGARP